jgi:pimeloyl-ACP methyl ester carboxylesterase
LKQADSALDFIYTSLTPNNAVGFRSGDLTTGFGRTLDYSLAEAEFEPITAEGVSLTGLFLDLIIRQGAGVILVESRRSSTAPLVVEVSGPVGIICRIPVPFYSVRLELAVDADHDGQIKLAPEDSSDATSASRPYRSWLNDDDDVHAPALPQRADYATPKVDGAKDLEDFFPVVLNLQEMVKALPPDASTKYRLKQADGAVNFVETSLTRATAFTYRTTTSAGGFGAALAEPAASATTQPVTAAGVELSAQFLNFLKDHDQGVILVEGRTPSTQPLVLTVERDGRPVAEVSLPLSLGARILLLLHGMNSNPATWDTFRAAAFAGSSTDLFDGKLYPPVTGAPPRPSACGVLCYRLKFGAVESTKTTREGLEHLTTTSAEGYLGSTVLPYLNIDIKCGDFETFDELGHEVDITVKALLDRYPNAQIVLLGHSRGGLAARSFLEGTSPRKSAVVGLLTTTAPHLGSRLAQIYQWLTDHPRPAGSTDDDWQVVDFLRQPTVTLAGITVSEKETLDVRRPIIGDVAGGPHGLSAALTALNDPAAVAKLPADIAYGEIVYEKAPLGLMTIKPPSLIRYTVLDEAGTANPFNQLSDAATAYILGPGNTPASFPGDGLIPAGNQVYTQLPGFPISSSGFHPNTINRLIVKSPEVVHDGAPSRTDDLLFQLRLLAPGWFSPTNP